MEHFEELEVEVIVFDEDVITASTTCDEETPYTPIP